MKFIAYFLMLITAPALASQDSDFLAANEAYRAGNAAKLDRYAQRLKKSLLEVYVSYYQLHMGIQVTDAEAVKNFLSRPEDTPMIDLLRAEWLKLLGKKQQWAEFDAEYPRLIKEDADLVCYALQSRRRSDESAAMTEVRKLWFTGKGLPDSCGVLFDDALAAGIISDHDLNQRLRLAE